MWRLGGLIVTATEAPPEANSSLLVLLGGVAIAAMAPLGYVVVEIIKGWNARKAEPSVQSPTVDVLALAQDVAVLKDWRVTVREADNIHDHTVTELIGTVDEVKADLGDVLRWMSREHPGWRP